MRTLGIRGWTPQCAKKQKREKSMIIKTKRFSHFAIITIALFFLFPILPTFAQSFFNPYHPPEESRALCSEVILDKPGGTMEKIVEALPRVAQSGGTCSFQTATQLYDAWRMNHEQNFNSQLSSPLELDFRLHSRIHSANPNSGGSTLKNLIALQNEGACPRNFFNPNNGRDQDEYIMRVMVDSFFQLRKTYFEANKIPFSAPKSTSTHWQDSSQNAIVANFLFLYPQTQIEDVLSIEQKMISQFLNLNQKEGVFKLKTNLNQNVLFQSFMEGNFVVFAESLFNIGCSDHEKIKSQFRYQVQENQIPRRMINDEWSKNSGILEAIDLELNQGELRAMPIAIGYCADVLTMGEAYKKYKGSCSNHASMVIGRKFNETKKQCEYLVRNSWGCKNCYAKQFERVEGKDHLWISGDLLSSATYETLTIRGEAKE